MSDGNMAYEDWLRGCVYHDGRHGYVTLPCDEVLKIADFIERLRADRKTEPQRDCFLCKWLGEVDVCGRCRNRNLFAEADTEPQQVVRLKHFKCPKCGRSDYIRSFEDWGVDGGIYKYKCINCNTYIKDEPNSSEKPNNCEEQTDMAEDIVCSF